MAPVQPMHCLGQFNRKARLVAGMRPTPAPAHAGPHDAAYRYVRHEPCVDVVLFGTGDLGASMDQYRFDPETAAARLRSGEAAKPVQPSTWRRAGGLAGTDCMIRSDPYFVPLWLARYATIAGSSASSTGALNSVRIFSISCCQSARVRFG